jgi:hypothetical protein
MQGPQRKQVILGTGKMKSTGIFKKIFFDQAVILFNTDKFIQIGRCCINKA